MVATTRAGLTAALMALVMVGGSRAIACGPPPPEPLADATSIDAGWSLGIGFGCGIVSAGPLAPFEDGPWRDEGPIKRRRGDAAVLPESGRDWGRRDG